MSEMLSRVWLLPVAIPLLISATVIPFFYPLDRAHCDARKAEIKEMLKNEIAE